MWSNKFTIIAKFNISSQIVIQVVNNTSYWNMKPDRRLRQELCNYNAMSSNPTRGFRYWSNPSLITPEDTIATLVVWRCIRIKATWRKNQSWEWKSRHDWYHCITLHLHYTGLHIRMLFFLTLTDSNRPCDLEPREPRDTRYKGK